MLGSAADALRQALPGAGGFDGGQLAAVAGGGVGPEGGAQGGARAGGGGPAVCGPGRREGAAERPAVVRGQLRSAADALQKALRLVRGGGRAADINSELSAAGTFVDTCQDSFDEFPDVDGSPLANVQTNLSRLVSNSLNLAAALH
uniref:Pectinesterase inhibitor domain-containing protein n=1 Tax=Ananas comosus var. bracteatus TaxID=296719 RepID=A0A6V7NYT0_ANACO|nr:unnamed protein product [Ananas comosus var. bracteatus]